jgi:N-acetylglucosaminyl-diphospho-decaprenol L-rhamnosyltransferase
MTTAVVVVSHDTRDEALACLAGLAGHSGPKVLVDAGSRDDTVAAVRSAYPDVVVLALDNVGYGRSVNAAVQQLDADVDVVVAVNADVRLDAAAIATMTAALHADADLGAVGPRVRYPDGGHQASARRIPGLRDALVHGLVGWLVPSNPATRRYRALDLTRPEEPGTDGAAPTTSGVVQLDWLSGCALALRRSAFEAVGGFDPGYRLFVEDVDLCDRLARAGWRIGFVADASVVHGVGASTAGRPLRSRIEHARGLDRYVAQRSYGVVRLARPLLWGGLAGWTLATTASTLLRPRRSSTGERRVTATGTDGAAR